MTTQLHFICLLFVVLLTSSIVLLVLWPINVSAGSPPFGLQEVVNKNSQWSDMYGGREIKTGPPYTNITSVTYSSDGKFLNATLWLSAPLYSSTAVQKPSANLIDYGMLIDSDLNNKTGLQGVDYIYDIRYDNTTQSKQASWTKTLQEYSYAGGFRDVVPPERNYTKFFQKDKDYVELDLDLKHILFPPKYRVFFYAYSYQYNRNPCCLLDAIRWIYIPPPEFSIKTLPASINVTAGDKAYVELFVNSTTGFVPTVCFKVLLYLTANVCPTL